MNLPALKSSVISEKYESSSEILGLVFPIMGIIASILIAVMIILPKVNEIRSLQESNKQLEQRASSLQSKISALASLDKNKLEEQLIASEQLLPSTKNTFSFLSQIEGASVTSGIVLNKVDVATSGRNSSKSRSKVVKKADSSGSSESIKLSISSDYQSLLQFLTAVNLFSRVSIVDDIKINVSSADGAQLSASFSVEGYWRELPASLGSVESPVQTLTPLEVDILEDVTKPESSVAPELPAVPVGRGNLFTPF